MSSATKSGCVEPILLVSESYHSADMYYASGFLAPDRFVYLCQDDKKYLFVSQMEFERAKKEAKVKNVHSMEEYDYRGRLKALRDPDLAFVDTLAAIFQSLKINRVRVPVDFPLLVADLLRKKGMEVIPAARLFDEARSVKAPDEIEKIKKAQAVNEVAMEHAISIIEASKPVNGVLHYEGKPLTSELLQSEIDMVFVRNGYDTTDSIVAAGPGSSDPHFSGMGPIKENEPIVIDIYPYGKKSRYWADMTRTVVKGRPTPEVQKMYDAVLGAQNVALNAIKAGVTGKQVHDMVCDYFEKRGYGTTRTGATEGFIHTTGHGVGINIHEYPSIGDAGLEPLKPGQVVTVEPGLYIKGIGGVRIEDMVVVTDKGNINLTKSPKKLVV
jgi:Xaa-Pro aminopeptidase